MCDPLSFASFTIGAFSQLANYEAQQQAADQQNETYRQNAYAANKAAQQQSFDINQRILQEQEAAAGQKEDQYRQVQAAQATAAVAAGEAGVSGLSVDALLREFSAKGSQASDRVDQQTEWNIAQLNNQKTQVQAQAADRINSVQRAASPSFFTTGLGILGSGLDSYSAFKDRQRDRNPYAVEPRTTLR